MSRLRYSSAGFIRKLKMYSEQVFIFIEGREDDPFFYGALCTSLKREKPYTYRFISAEETPFDGGGKEALLKLFAYLRQNRVLAFENNGRKQSTFFFVDKDIDEILRIKKRSTYLVYTRYYDIQNHIYENGNLVRGSAAAGSIDPSLLAGWLDNSHDWCKRIAINWKDWIKLCVFCRKYRLNEIPNYRYTSKINMPITGPVNAKKLSECMQNLQEVSGMSEIEFSKCFASVSKRVERYFLNNDYHKIFKGKWFSYCLEAEIKQRMGGQPYKHRNIGCRLCGHVAQTLDFDADWAEHFKAPLRAIIQALYT